MEGNKKKLPSLPSNYVTLVQLQERWRLKQQQQQQQNKIEEQVEPEPEPEPEPKPNVLVKSEKKLPTVPSNFVTVIQLRERWIKEKQRKQNETGEEEDDQVEPQLNPPQDQIGNRDESEKSEVDACVFSCESIDDKTAKDKAKKKNMRNEWKKKKREEADDNELTGDETHAPQTSDEKDEIVKPRNVVVADPTLEIEGRFGEMSIDGGKEGMSSSNNGSIHRRNRQYHHGGGDNRRSGNCRWKEVEVEGRLGEMSIDGGKDTIIRPNNGARNQKSGNARWIKKGEASGGGAHN